MQFVDFGNEEFVETSDTPGDWSDLGRLVRRAAMAAVTLHFAELAVDEHATPLDERYEQVEPVSR